MLALHRWVPVVRCGAVTDVYSSRQVTCMTRLVGETSFGRQNVVPAYDVGPTCLQIAVNVAPVMATADFRVTWTRPYIYDPALNALHVFRPFHCRHPATYPEPGPVGAESYRPDAYSYCMGTSSQPRFLCVFSHLNGEPSSPHICSSFVNRRDGNPAMPVGISAIIII